MNTYFKEILDKYSFMSKQLDKKPVKERMHEMKSLTQFVLEYNLDKTQNIDLYTYQLLGLYDLSDIDILDFNINEKYGAFDKQKELVKYIYNKIRNYNNETIYAKENKIDNIEVFFNKIEIIFDDESGYIPSLSKFNKEQKIFDNIIIKLNKNKNRPEIIRDLFHELTHAWTDYGFHIKDYPYTLNDIITSKSYVMSMQMSKDYKSLKVTDENSKKFANILLNVAKSGYILNKIEQNAFVSEIQAELLNYEGELLVFDKFKKMILELKEIKNFFNLFEYLEKINKDSESSQQTFLFLYNNMLENKKFNTFNQLYKYLNNKLAKSFDKISITISKVYCDWVQSQKELSLSNNLITDKINT